LGRERIIERERRWAAPAGGAAVGAFALFIVSVIIQQAAGISTSNSEAVVERSLHDHGSTIIAVSVLRAVAFVLLPVPFLYLFRAAQARNPRVQATMVGFIFIGPILFAAQGVVAAVGQANAASQFVNQAPTEKTETFAAFERQLKQDPRSIAKVTIYTNKKQLEVEQASGAFYKVDRYPPSAESSLPGDLNGAQLANETDSNADSQAGDAFATHVVDDNGAIRVSGALAIPALLGLVVMMIYVPLQAQRVGLLTRFMGSLGMALGASLVILPPALLAVLLWTGYLGLLFVGKVPSGRPPAWDAGEAVPWPRPGEEAPARTGGEAVDGKATEVAQGAEGSSGSEGKSPPAKRKRKRRR
jgi:hypothetical protein